MKFIEFFENAPRILGEGAVIERLRRETDFDLDEHVVNSAFIYKTAQRQALASIYRQYLDIGYQFDLPIMLSTTTWRASRERIALAGYADRDVNGDNFLFLDNLRKEYGAYSEKVAICGLMSCRGDAYDPSQALTTKDARKFHAWQADKLAAAGVDFLMAATLPKLGEAIGLAQALAATGLPYMISFVARPEGTLLDGTPFTESIETIDTGVTPKPLAFLVNCTHAAIFRSAMMHEENSSAHVRERICGLLANTAALTPEELDNSDQLVSEAPESFGKTVSDLHKEMGMKLLGGCCGTNDQHIRHLAKRLAEQ